MKILLFVDKLFGGGAQRVASILLNHLCTKHCVTAVIFNDKHPTYPLDPRIKIQKITIDGGIRFLHPIERIHKIRHSIKNNDPDLIISFLVDVNIYTLLANIFNKRKIIVSERNTLNHVRSRFIRLLRFLTYPTADKIVFVTKADNEKFGCKRKSVTLYNPSMFLFNSDYTNREKTIITIASTNRWYDKGLDILIAAWAKISAQNPKWRLEIMGRADYNKIPNELRRLQQERVTWLGWKDNVDKILRDKSIFVLASRFEGCPNSLIEAMNQGCACLATDCDGGMKEIITDGKSGILARNGDADDLATKLQLLIDNEELRKRLSSCAIEEVKRFDKELIMKQWDELIQSTIKS